MKKVDSIMNFFELIFIRFFHSKYMNNMNQYSVSKRVFKFRNEDFPYFELILPEGKKEFNIAQLTDQHLIAGGFFTNKELKRFVESFKELGIDLIMNTGDLFCRNSLWLIRWVLRSFNKFFSKIAPWTFAWGNHDTENFDRKGKCKNIEDPVVSLEELIANLPNALFLPTHKKFKAVEGKSYEEEINSEQLSEDQRKKMKEPQSWEGFFGGNFAIVVSSTKEGKKIPQFNLMVLNSRRNMHLPDKVLEWMKEFIEKESAVDTILFYHVPNYAFHELWESGSATGIKRESVCFEFDKGRIHNYLKQIPSIKAVFVGHDHVNDYWGVKDGIYYVYGRKSSLYGYGGKKDYFPDGVKGIKIGFKYIQLQMGPRKAIKIRSICGMKNQQGKKILEECKEVAHQDILL